jgi:hypothetical protein
MANLTIVAGLVLCMTLLTHVHLHDFRAVSREAVLFVKGVLLLLRHIAMTFGAGYIFGLVGGVGKIDVVGLCRVDSPGNFLLVLDVLLYQNPFVLRLPHLGFVALLAVLEPGNSRVGTVRAKGVAVLATGILMGSVAEIDGLLAFGEKDFGEDHPTHNQGNGKPRKENDSLQNGLTGLVGRLLLHKECLDWSKEEIPDKTYL